MNRKIIFATDFSKNNRKGLNFLLRNYHKDDEVSLLHVICDSGFSDPPIDQREADHEIALKKEKLKEIAIKLNCKVKLELLVGDISKSIESYSQKMKPDMIIIGSHRFSFFDKFLNKDIRQEVLNMDICPIVCC